MGQLEARREYSERRLQSLRDRLESTETLIGDKGCVFVIGSYGRGEATEHSDLDLFIVGDLNEKARTLPYLEEVCVWADLVRASEGEGLPPFSGDGEWLKHYTTDELLAKLGTREDDVINTFTARLLLLLESRPLLGDGTYASSIDRVIRAYWTDYDDHDDAYMPAFFANDVLRLWRTFCVNYEANTQSEPEEEKAKRKLKNYKLKHSRLLTCYSALAYMLGVYDRQGTVHPADITEMVRLTPTARLEHLRGLDEHSEAHPALDVALEKYERFLETTASPPDQLLEEFRDKEKAAHRYQEARELGKAVFNVLKALGEDSPFYRLLMV